MTQTDDARGLDLDRLISWGFAPGAYSGFCSECGKQHIADKRAWRCLECAERRADLAPTPQDARVTALVEALRPFSACVFNDNGDVTISTGHLGRGDWLALDRAAKALAAFDKDATP